LPEKVSKVVSGSIIMEGQELQTIPETMMRDIYRGQRIAMIFQDPMTSLNPVLRVGEQIAEALLYHNTEKKSRQEIEKRVDETLELVGIPKSRKNEYPHQFSGGMKQRVVIAMALACEPDLLIADEPTTALDVTIQAQVLAMMSELREKLNTAMIMITHDLGIVAQMCDKVAVMYAGELVEQGKVEDIFSEGRHHPYTEGLFGSIPNLKIETERLMPIEGMPPDPTNLPKGCYFYPRCSKCMDICRNEHPREYEHNGHSIRCHLFRNSK
jgi:peptide/nickel transport system ATP-binding protein